MSAGRAITNSSFRMLTEQTIERLRTLRLGAIADAYLAQQRDPSAASLSFDERLGMLVDAEQLARDNRALTRRLKEAKLRLSDACLEDLDYSGRKLDRAVIRHRVPAQRSTFRYFRRRCYAEGLSKAMVTRSVGAHAVGLPVCEAMLAHWLAARAGIAVAQGVTGLAPMADRSAARASPTGVARAPPRVPARV